MSRRPGSRLLSPGRAGAANEPPRSVSPRSEPPCYDVVVIGGGAAGIAAATAAVAADPAARVALVERDDRLGGILLQCLHTGFGLDYFAAELTGSEYAARIVAALPPSIEVMLETHVVAIDGRGGADPSGAAVHPCIVELAGLGGRRTVAAGKVILATGSREIPFGALGIPSQRPAGILTAGEAQYLMNRQGLQPGRRAVILGAGDIGLIMARRFLFEGFEVAAVLEIAERPGGVERNVQTCVRDYGIPLLTRTTVVEVHGRQRVEAVTIAEVDDQRRPRFATARILACDTLLVAVGLVPEIDLAIEAGAARDGRTLVEPAPAVAPGRTTLPWLAACGNARRIHPIVDDVSREGELVGARVGGRPEAARDLAVHKTASATARPGIAASCREGGGAARGDECCRATNHDAGDLDPPPHPISRICLACPRSCPIAVGDGARATGEVRGPLRSVGGASDRLTPGASGGDTGEVIAIRAQEDAGMPGQRLCPRGQRFLAEERVEPRRHFFSTWRPAGPQGTSGELIPYRTIDPVPLAAIRQLIADLRRATGPVERSRLHAAFRRRFACRDADGAPAD